MPRAARRDLTSRVLHVLNRGNDRATVFHKDGDYAAFLRCFAAAKSCHPVKTFALCLMPNHFHLILETDGPSTLAAFMQRWMTAHVRRYHAHYHSSGHLWQGRFKSFPITDDDHFRTVWRYVLQNPVRAGLVSRARDWRWSSLNFRELVDPPPMPQSADFHAWLTDPLPSEKVDALRALINQPSLLRAPPHSPAGQSP